MKGEEEEGEAIEGEEIGEEEGEAIEGEELGEEEGEGEEEEEDYLCHMSPWTLLEMSIMKWLT